MEVETRPKPQDDQMSDCRSFGSNYRPSSQSRKISIGILVDSSLKKSQAAREDEAVALDAERENSKKENSVEGRNKGKAVIDASEGIQIEIPEQINSPWITTKSCSEKNLNSEAGFHPHGTSKFPATVERWNKLCMVKDAPVTHSVHYFANQTSNLHPDDDKQKNFVGFTYKRKGRNSQKAQEFTFGTSREVVSAKEATEDKNDDRTETLRKNLQEILGTISSPKSQPSCSQAQEPGGNHLVSGQVPNKKGDEAVKPRQNSDTIEIDSKRPVDTIKRPITRSLTRKGVSTKVQLQRTKAALSSSYRQKPQEKHIFSFQERQFGKDNPADNDGPTLSTRKQSERKVSGIELRNICLNKKVNASEILKAAHRSGTPELAERISSVTNKIGSCHGCPSWNKHVSIEQDRNQQKESLLSPHVSPNADSYKSLGENYHQSSRKTSHQSSRTHKANREEDFNSPAVAENGDQQEDFSNPTKNIFYEQENFQTPMFKIDTPACSSFPCSTPKTDQINQGCGPELAEITFTMENIRSFSTLQNSKADLCPSSADTKFYDEAEELKDSLFRKHSPLMSKKVLGESLTESSSKDGDSDSSEEGSPIADGLREGDTLSPETATAERSNFQLYPTKRLHSREDLIFSKFTPTSPTPQGTGESDWNPENSEQHHEDKLERVTMLLGLAIENFKKKLNLATRKKSSEILMTISEDIHLQLQNIKTQIQTELGEVTTVSKSKRKHLETRFQEQQEQLRLINDKFQQDMRQHLQDCESTLEGLDLHHNELKGTYKKQKASHHKLLMQVEEAMETKLNDAHRRITTVNKLAREKMLHLRHAIAECLQEGISN